MTPIGRLAYLPIGLHNDVPAAAYHRDPCERPSLSSSLAKILLGSTSRHAWWSHPRLNPDFESSDDSKFDLGSVAHELILGRGGGYTIVEAQDWRTRHAQDKREAAREVGKTAVLLHQFRQAQDMANAVILRLLEIEDARHLIDPLVGVAESRLTEGTAERVAIWEDVGGALCRAMIDWQGEQLFDVWDLKTTANNLSDASLARLIDNLGYDLSAAFYIRGLTALIPDIAGRFRFRWIFVQDMPPHEVRVIEASPALLELGDRKAALAVAKWARCLAANDWPGYPAEITRLDPLPWAIDRQAERELIDDDARDFRPLSRPLPSQAAEILGPC